MLKTVFICSRYASDNASTQMYHLQRAQWACQLAIIRGYAPYAPHLYLPNFLDDKNPGERAQGLEIGMTFLEKCDEMWIYELDGIYSDGMRQEIAKAKELQKPIYMLVDGFELERYEGKDGK